MSAYICDAATIVRIVTHWSTTDVRWTLPDLESPDGARVLDPRSLTDVQAAFDDFVEENARSVDYRYRETNSRVQHQIGTGDFPPRPLGQLDRVATYKCIECLDYQSCEHPGWVDSHARRNLVALMEHLFPKGRPPRVLWDPAPWGVSTPWPADCMAPSAEA